MWTQAIKKKKEKENLLAFPMWFVYWVMAGLILSVLLSKKLRRIFLKFVSQQAILHSCYLINVRIPEATSLPNWDIMNKKGRGERKRKEPRKCREHALLPVYVAICASSCSSNSFKITGDRMSSKQNVSGGRNRSAE